MKQEFNWAMDQVKLPPEAEERILRALEDRAQAPRRKRRKGPLIAVLAAAAALLMGAAAVAGLSPVLERYFADTPKEELSLLGAGAYPIGISQSYEGWTVTLTDCVGDDHNIYIGIQVDAPEGTVLAPPEEAIDGGFSFDEYLLDLKREDLAGSWALAKLEDDDPTDNRICYVMEVHTYIFSSIQDTSGLTADIELNGFYDYWRTEAQGEIQQHDRSSLTEAVQNHAFQFKDVPLNYDDRTIRLSPHQQIQLLDGTTTVTSVEISPITVTARVEGGACVQHHELVSLDGSCNGLITMTLHMKDGTQIEAGDTGVGSGCAYDPEDKSSPYGAFIQTTRYYNDMGEPFRFIDPTQVESVEVCGVVIPVENS